MDRRTFLRHAAVAGGATLFAPWQKVTPVPEREAGKTAQVVLVKTEDRLAGTQRALDMLGMRSYRGGDVFLKPNYNSDGPAPASTHNDVLAAMVGRLQDSGAKRITVGDRSGMGDTWGVMRNKGVFTLANELDFETLVFEDLRASDWRVFQPGGSHWAQGFAIPKPVLDADAVVQACCLKTHQYGGHFTMSLKNSVGLAAKYVPGDSYNFMTELHNSPFQRHMIAEINAAYAPDFVVVDGVEAYVNGGPANGDLVKPGVILASADRIAVDAVGVAILRYFGTTPEVSQGTIFEQAQIARAVELGLGVSGPAQIELVTDDEASAAFASAIRPILVAT